tara:strand:- start:840 stop:1118 length:279 start_codon:yes stop_codon:yes gene_type:complete
MTDNITAIPTDVAFTALIVKVPDPKATPPARPGCARYQRWQILATMDGSTVSDYYKACKDAGLACTANNPRDAHAKGFIVLTAVKKGGKKKD